MSQADAGGLLPTWLVNMVSRIVAPQVYSYIHIHKCIWLFEIKISCLKFFKKLSKACLNYDKWKAKHNSEHKPWNNPLRIPPLDSRDIVASEDDKCRIDEHEVAHE